MHNTFLEQTLNNLQSLRSTLKMTAMSATAQQLEHKRAKRLASREQSMETASQRRGSHDSSRVLFGSGSGLSAAIVPAVWSAAPVAVQQTELPVPSVDRKKKSLSVTEHSIMGMAARLASAKPTEMKSGQNIKSQPYAMSEAKLLHMSAAETPKATERANLPTLKPRALRFEETATEGSSRSGSMQMHIDGADYILYSRRKPSAPQTLWINISEVDKVSQPTPELAKQVVPTNIQASQGKENQHVSRLEWSFRPKDHMSAVPVSNVSQTKTPEHRALGFAKKSLGTKWTDLNVSTRSKRNSMCTSGTASHLNTSNNSFANLSGILSGAKRPALQSVLQANKPPNSTMSVANILRMRPPVN